MSKVYTYKDAIKLLKPKLPLYLKLFDRDPEKGNFRCLLPERHKNRDDVHSMGIVPQSNGEVAHCFTCNLNVDIFHAAHILEGLPINGSEFYEVTVPRLCKLFGIDFDFDEDSLDSDTRKRIMLYGGNADKPKTALGRGISTALVKKIISNAMNKRSTIPANIRKNQPRSNTLISKRILASILSICRISEIFFKTADLPD